MSDVTQILTAVRAGDDAAAEGLFELVYAELRQVAAQKMARDSAFGPRRVSHLGHQAADRSTFPHHSDIRTGEAIVDTAKNDRRVIRFLGGLRMENKCK